jgi:hypothetical protein
VFQKARFNRRDKNHKFAVPYEDEGQEQKTRRLRRGGLLAGGGGCIVHTQNISLIEPKPIASGFGASEDQQG